MKWHNAVPCDKHTDTVIVTASIIGIKPDVTAGTGHTEITISVS
jgi:hypothetical protein